jgi:FAD/FMN-containing dehydrogenase
MSATFTLRVPGTPLAPRRSVRVHSADELRRALREARDQPLALDASCLDRLLRADDDCRTLEVQGAMSWSGVAACLGGQAARLAPWLQTAGLPPTVAQAVGADAAGPDGAPLAACIEAVALATVDGELRRLDRTRDADLFRLVIGGQGVFGLIYSVTLRIDALLCAAQSLTPPVEIHLPGCAPAAALASRVETLLPPQELEGFLDAARTLALEHRFALRRVAVTQLRKGAETALSWATRDWAGVTLAIESATTLGASVHAAGVRRLLYAEAIRRGGSFPARRAPDATPAQLDTCYPQLPAFLAEKRRYDPAERLQNPWYRGVTGLMRYARCEARWTS